MTELIQGRYRLEVELGRGAMGIVWRARDEKLGRPVAVKELVMSPGIDRTEAVGRFLTEAQAAGKLAHPTIVTIHDVFSDGERPFIVMELIDGPTVADVVRASGAQPPETVRAVMAQVAQALAAAHRAEVVHRDLKPENVFWTSDGCAIVADFGLARIGAGRGTLDGTVMGTPGYMSPEQVRGLAVGPPTDVFGWGALAYELATGVPPFGEPSFTDPGALAYRVVHEAPSPIELPGDPVLADLVTRAMAKDPEDRPQDGSELVAALARWSDRVQRSPASLSQTRPGAAQARAVALDDDTESVTAGEPDGKRRFRAAMGLAAIGACLLVVLVAVGLSALSSSESSGRAASRDTVASTTGGLSSGAGSVLATTTGMPTTSSPSASPPTSSPPASSTSSLAPGGQATVFSDDFSAQRWSTLDNDSVTYAYVNGELHMRNKTQGTSTNAPSTGASPASVRIEVDARKVDSDRVTMGVTCRSGTSYGTFYAAQVSSSGTWALSKFDGGVSRRLAGPQSSSVVKTDGTNRVSLDCAGGDAGLPVHLKLSLNGVTVGEADDPSGLALGRAGLLIGGIDGTTGEVAYDNFVVTRL